MNANPKGRLDVLALAVAERLTAKHVESRIGFPVWDALKPLAERGIKEGMKRLRVPRKNLLATPLGKIVMQAMEGQCTG
jgi:hypothetical protein